MDDDNHRIDVFSFNTLAEGTNSYLDSVGVVTATGPIYGKSSAVKKDYLPPNKNELGDISTSRPTVTRRFDGAVSAAGSALAYPFPFYVDETIDADKVFYGDWAENGVSQMANGVLAIHVKVDATTTVTYYYNGVIYTTKDDANAAGAGIP